MTSTDGYLTETQELAREALLAAGRSSRAERSTGISQLGSVLRANATAMERAIAIDTDKLRPDAAAEVRSAIDACTFYGLNARHWSHWSDWPSGANRSPGVIIAETPLGNPLWRLTRLALPVLLGGGVVVVTCPERSSRTVELLARAVESAGFPHGTVTVRTEEPRPLSDVRTRRATYNYAAHPSDTPEGIWEPLVVASSEGVWSLARRAVRRAGSPGSPVTPSAVRLVATPWMHDELCRAVAHAVRDAPAVSWRSTPGAGALSVAYGTRLPLVLVEAALDIDSALDLVQGTAFGLHPLVAVGEEQDQVGVSGGRPWQISEVWSARAEPAAGNGLDGWS